MFISNEDFLKNICYEIFFSDIIMGTFVRLSHPTLIVQGLVDDHILYDICSTIYKQLDEENKKRLKNFLKLNFFSLCDFENLCGLISNGQKRFCELDGLSKQVDLSQEKQEELNVLRLFQQFKEDLNQKVLFLKSYIISYQCKMYKLEENK